MNITIDRVELLHTAKRMATIAPLQSPLDVLRGALLEADAQNSRLILTATNMELSLRESLPCQTREDDALVVGAQLLADMLEKLAGDTVTLTRQADRNMVTLQSGSACYTVPIWSRSSFPKPELPFPEDTVVVAGIPAMARRTVFAVSDSESKPLMRCVNLMFTQNGLRAAGSDGVCIVAAKGDDKSVGNISLLVPASSLEKLARITRDDDQFRVGTTGKCIVFFRENFLFSARLMDGNYIDTERLMLAIHNQFTVLSDIAELRKALNAALCVGADGKLRVEFDGSRLTFHCTGTGANAASPTEVIPLTGSPQGEYWYSARKLASCLRALNGTVTMGVAQNGMLTITAQDAVYVQSAMRPPAQSSAAGKAA